MSSRPMHIIGLLTLLLLAVLCANVITRPKELTATSVNLLMQREQENSILTPCSRFTDGYAQLPFQDGNFPEWPQYYHTTAAAVIEEHLQSFMRAPKCAAATGNDVLPAGPKLQELAKKLPGWKGAAVSQWEMSSVLLEFLRAYECALQERLYFLHQDAIKTLENASSAQGQDTAITLTQLITQVSEEDETIARELAVARPTLNRSLAVLAGLSRLLPLHTELQCIERASLDIRNALALGAEASACLPRIWNAKDPLRDLPQ
ncbi:MAG: hypothetical protein PHX87_00385 [Candidatus Peribacteraceae bacterium]|nr:hypothetical protein [Candidatus Peribacteraceae bacterium]MDD5741865.1 hypothetical protein [Candidatus Peribacteraceae bacterium]